ncbi:MAG: hypothetical protein RMA76_08930 [Deltaproteobacteria bacterium]|jgi:hypothetical protein
MTHRTRIRIPLIALGALAALGVANEARADITVQASAGTSFMLAASDDIASDRGPVTFDVGPGWDIGMLRLEIPLVFGIDEPDVYPRAQSTFLGFRPQAKVFPFDWLYGKLSAPILFPGGDADLVLGVTVGGGLEIEVADVILLHGELNFSPYVTPSTAIPIEGRVGATFKF